MSDDTRWWVLDLAILVLVADVAGALVYFDAPAVLRVPAALLLILVLPGYALTAVFFPAKNRHDVDLITIDDGTGGLLNPLPADYEIGGAERAVLSVTLSIGLVPAVAAVISLRVGGLALGPILGAVLSMIVALAVVAFVRRLRLPRSQRFGVDVGRVASLPRPFREPSRLHQSSGRIGLYNTVAVVGLLLVATSVAYAVAFPPRAEGFTEFYVDSEDYTGTTSAPYPSEFTAGESHPVSLGIANHEHQTVQYTVVAVIQDDGRGSGGTTVGRATTTLADGERGQLQVDVEPTRAGDDRRLQFLLYRGAPPADPSTDTAYRVLDLSITVGGGGGGF